MSGIPRRGVRGGVVVTSDEDDYDDDLHRRARGQQPRVVAATCVTPHDRTAGHHIPPMLAERGRSRILYVHCNIDTARRPNVAGST